MSRDTVKLDFALQFYVHRHFIPQCLHGIPKPRLYWNTDSETPTATNQLSDVPVVLSYEKRGWRLVFTAGWKSINEPAL